MGQEHYRAATAVQETLQKYNELQDIAMKNDFEKFVRVNFRFGRM